MPPAGRTAPTACGTEDDEGEPGAHPGAADFLKVRKFNDLWMQSIHSLSSSNPIKINPNAFPFGIEKVQAHFDPLYKSAANPLPHDIL